MPSLTDIANEIKTILNDVATNTSQTAVTANQIKNDTAAAQGAGTLLRSVRSPSGPAVRSEGAGLDSAAPTGTASLIARGRSHGGTS